MVFRQKPFETEFTVLQDLLRHMEWADAKVWTSVLASPAAQEDTTIREVLFHIHNIQWAYLQIWLEQPPSAFPDPSKFPNSTDLALWARQGHEEIGSSIKRIEGSVDKVIAVPFARLFEARFGKSDAEITLAHTILQATSHSSLHRGQVTLRLQDVGAEPPAVGFMPWLWMGRPPGHWPNLQQNAISVGATLR